MRQATNQTKAVMEVWDICLQYRWRFIVAAFLAMVAVLGGSLLMPRKYAAQATFERRTDVVLSEIISHGASSAFEDPLQSMTEEVAGQPAIDELIEQIIPLMNAAGSDDRQITRQKLRRDMNRVVVKNVINTNLLDRVTVSYTASDPWIARTTVNSLVKNYLRRARGLIEQRLSRTADFFRAEVERQNDVIERLQNEQLSFEIEQAELLPDNPNSVVHVLAQTQSRLSMLEQQRNATAQRIEVLTKALVNTHPTVPSTVEARNPKIDRLHTKLDQLNGQLAQFLDEFKMQEKHPDVQDLRHQIKAVENDIAETDEHVVTEQHTAFNPKYAELQLQLTEGHADLDAKRAQFEALSKRVDQLTEQSTNLFPVRAQYNKLIRQVKQAQRQQTFWEDNLRRVNLALTAEEGNRGITLEFIKPSDRILKPISPDVTQVLMAAIGLALMAGSVMVFLAHRMDDAFHDGEQAAETLDLPLFGSVSEIISRQQHRTRRIRRMVLFPLNLGAMAAVALGLAALLYISLEKPHLLGGADDDDPVATAAHAAQDIWEPPLAE